METTYYSSYFIKWLVAFLIPIAWTIIFYPLMRRLKKAYPFLIIIATLLSFVVLIITDFMQKLSPLLGDAVVYLSGIFFGTAALSLLFISRSRWLEEPAMDSMPSGSPHGKLHLRHVLQLSIILEEEGRKFYELLGSRAVNQGVKDLCRKLVEDEIRHKKTFENIYFRWLPFYLDEATMQLFESELKRRGIFLNPPPSDTTEREMIKYAIDQEEKMAEFYAAFEKVFPEAWRRINIEHLVMEEREHAKQLMTMLPTA